eukprot:155301-Karenia_brevis.AAC.1
MKLDELARMDLHAQSINATLDAAEPVQMYAHISRYLPKAKNTSVFINNSDGSPAAGLVQHKSNFRSDISKLMMASERTFQERIDQHRQSVID